MTMKATKLAAILSRLRLAPLAIFATLGLCAAAPLSVSGDSSSTTPNTYTPIEYIKTTKTQCIQTGYTPTPNTWMDARIAFGPKESWTYVTGTCFKPFSASEASGNQYSANFGSDQGQSGEIFFWLERGYDGANKWSIAFGNANASWQDGMASEHTLKVEKNLVTWGTKTVVPETRVNSATKTLVLAGNSDEKPFSAYESMYIYSWKIYESDDGTSKGANNHLVRDYVPVKNGSGVPGLFDRVNGVFYPSATDTPLVAGPDVDPSTLTFLERLEFDTRRVAAGADPCASGGDIVLQDGDDYIHIFTNVVGQQTFTVNQTCSATALLVGGQRFQKDGVRDVFVVAHPILLKFFSGYGPFETKRHHSEGNFGFEIDGRWSGVRLPVASQDVSRYASS